MSIDGRRLFLTEPVPGFGAPLAILVCEYFLSTYIKYCLTFQERFRTLRLVFLIVVYFLANFRYNISKKGVAA